MKDEIVQIWVTRYALSGGIKSGPARLNGDGLAEFVDHKYDYYHGEGRDWHRTPEAALIRAEEMRAAKIASLRKQIAKLEKLDIRAVVVR